MNTVPRLWFVFALQCLAGLAWAGDGASSLESRVKAAYLYNFASYVEWPAASSLPAGAPITIGFVEAAEIAEELSKLSSGRMVHNRPVEVKLIKPGEAVAGVQILFMGRQGNRRLKQLVEGVRAQPVLTVSDAQGGLSDGSIINFVPVDDRIRFEISLANAERNGIKINARLLSVAQRVENKEP